MSDKYLRFPLSLLRVCPSAASFFQTASCFSMLNAGIGYRAKNGDEAFDCYLQRVLDEMNEDRAENTLEELDDIELAANRSRAEEAIVGAHLCGVSLGKGAALAAWKSYDFSSDDWRGSPVISVKNQFFWNACYTARKEEGDNSHLPDQEISWREWRILVAVYSLQPNSKKFSCAGWECISRRACGFHRKEDYEDFEAEDAPWPDHCIPLSRRQTTHTVERLEALRFFIRHRISSGKVGGLMAYSIRHEKREQLANDCEEWQAFKRGETIKENRAQDQLLYAKATSKRAQRIKNTRSEAASILETYKSLQCAPITEPLKSSLKVDQQPANQPAIETCTSEVQVSVQAPTQPHVQHNEKYLSEKYESNKYLNNPSGGIASKERHLEDGFIFEGRFVLSADAISLMTQNPAIWKLFKRARRITSTEGEQRIEEVAA
jgi:hypothetical protein